MSPWTPLRERSSTLAMYGYLFRTYLIAISNATVVFIFEAFFAIVHLTLAIIFTKQYGMIGYAWAVIIGRGARLISGAILSLHFINKIERTSGQ